MRVLVTSSRMPFALDEIRKLGKQGHQVFATDTFRTSPGSHSRYLAGSRITASPRYDTAAFIADVAQYVRDEDIQLIVPAFEEALYLAKHRSELGTELYAPPLATLLQLHNKASMLTLAEQLDVRVPRSIVTDSREALADAIGDFERFFARPVYSRGGVDLFTNSGPLEGALRLEDCSPSPGNPWLVQEFVDGLDVCTFSVAHHGRVAAHSAYVHPREIEHAGGIVFESVVDEEAWDIATRFVRATGYNGQVSFDFKRNDEGLVLIECNPRPTAGVVVMSPQLFVDALLDMHPREVRIAEAGVGRKISVALIRDMVLHWDEAPEDLHHLLSDARDVYGEPGDLLPGLYQLLSYSHVIAYRRKLRVGEHRATDLAAAYFFDILYNGDEADAAG